MTSMTPTASTSGTSSYLAKHNQHDLTRPFKRVQVYSTSSSGRKRNYKQIIALEQEAHFDVGSAGIGNKKSKKKGGAGGSSATKTDSSTPGKLVGAAAKAAKRKEDRLRREAAAAAATATATSTTASTRASSEAADESVADESVADTTLAENTPDPDAEPGQETEEAKQARELAEKERARKRALPTFLSVEAPPSLRPAKKYCDVTGLLAPYTDPKTGLRYHSAEIYEVIKTFGPGVDEAYLALRGKVNTLV